MSQNNCIILKELVLNKLKKAKIMFKQVGKIITKKAVPSKTYVILIKQIILKKSKIQGKNLKLEN